LCSVFSLSFHQIIFTKGSILKKGNFQECFSVISNPFSRDQLNINELTSELRIHPWSVGYMIYYLQHLPLFLTNLFTIWSATHSFHSSHAWRQNNNNMNNIIRDIKRKWNLVWICSLFIFCSKIVFIDKLLFIFLDENRLYNKKWIYGLYILILLSLRRIFSCVGGFYFDIHYIFILFNLKKVHLFW
jgi:hypothetical protein